MRSVSLETIYRYNNEYDKILAEASVYFERLKFTNDCIDLEIVNNCCDYKATKNIYELIQDRMTDNEKKEKLKKLVEIKKEKESMMTE